MPSGTTALCIWSSVETCLPSPGKRTTREGFKEKVLLDLNHKDWADVCQGEWGLKRGEKHILHGNYSLQRSKRTKIFGAATSNGWNVTYAHLIVYPTMAALIHWACQAPFQAPYTWIITSDDTDDESETYRGYLAWGPHCSLEVESGLTSKESTAWVLSPRMMCGSGGKWGHKAGRRQVMTSVTGHEPQAGFICGEEWLVRFAFGTISLVTVQKINHRGQEQEQEDHLEGCYHNPGQKWQGSEPKQWQLRMEGRGQSQKKEGTEDEEGVGKPQDMISVVSTLKMRYLGSSKQRGPSGACIYGARAQDEEGWTRDPGCSRHFSHACMCARESLAQRTPWWCH